MNIKNLCIFGVAAFISACDERPRHNQSSEKTAYQQQLEQCRERLSQSNLVPIIGGGYIDIDRFGFGNPSVVYENGDCGTDMLEVDFWWTGKEVLPNHPKFVKLKEAERPRPWSYFRVVAKLGNQRRGRLCKENPELPQCEVFKAGIRSGLSVTEWPEDRVVRLKNYPGLELWLSEPPPNIENKLRVYSFVMTEWRRPDGTPRTIGCWGLNTSNEFIKSQGLDAHSLSLMSRDELSNIDFRGKLKFGASCEVDFGSFNFNGGAGRVNTNTESLHDAPEALQAISKYISKSIVRDDEQ